MNKQLEKNNAGLMEILKVNQNSDFGKKFHFELITSEEEYSKAIPIANMNAYHTYMELAKRLDETTILSCDPIECYLFEGDESFFCTNKQQTIYKHFWNICGAPRDFLPIWGKQCIFKNYGHYKETTLFPYLIQLSKGVKKYCVNSYRDRCLDMWHQSLNGECYQRKQALIALQAYKTHGFVISQFSDLKKLVMYIQKNLPQLLQEAKANLERNRVKIDKRNAMVAYLNRTNSWRNHVKLLMQKLPSCEWQACIRFIWPQLKSIVIIADPAKASPEDVECQKLNSVIDCKMYWMTAQSIFGQYIDAEGSVTIDSLPYTYLEFRDIQSGRIIPYSETVKIGRVYNVLITNVAGLYRYCYPLKFKVKKCDIGNKIIGQWLRT